MRVAYNDLGRRIGEGHPRARLTDAQVREIREQHEQLGLGYRNLARRLGLKVWTVKKILNFERRGQVARSWREVADGQPTDA